MIMKRIVTVIIIILIVIALIFGIYKLVQKNNNKDDGKVNIYEINVKQELDEEAKKIDFDYKNMTHKELTEKLSGVKSIRYSDSGKIVEYNAGYMAMYSLETKIGTQDEKATVNENEKPYYMKK